MSKSIYRDLFFALSFHPNLSGAAVKTFVAYVTRHGFEGAWPSVRTLETLTGQSRKTIIKAKKELQDSGLIEIHEGHGKKSDLVFIPLLVEYFHLSEVEKVHHKKSEGVVVDFLPTSGGKSTPEVGVLNTQDKKRNKISHLDRSISGENPPPLGGNIPPVDEEQCPHLKPSPITDHRTGGTHLFCKGCNQIIARDIPVERNRRRSLR